MLVFLLYLFSFHSATDGEEDRGIICLILVRIESGPRLWPNHLSALRHELKFFLFLPQEIAKDGAMGVGD
jgi:hypothetical protein